MYSLSTAASTKKRITRLRQANSDLPQEPADLQNFILHEKYKYLPSDGDESYRPFLRYDSGVDENNALTHDKNRFLIFMSKRGMENLAKKKSEWCCDATFDYPPHIFKQFFTIHVKIGKSYSPSCYV